VGRAQIDVRVGQVWSYTQQGNDGTAHVTTYKIMGKDNYEWMGMCLDSRNKSYKGTQRRLSLGMDTVGEWKLVQPTNFCGNCEGLFFEDDYICSTCRATESGSAKTRS
jgi:hypothetical protein